MITRKQGKADPEKKKASVRDSYNADIESKQSAKRQRYQEENLAAKRQDNSAAIKASERNRYWNDPAVRLLNVLPRGRGIAGVTELPLPPKAVHHQQKQQRCPHHHQPKQQSCPYRHQQQREHRYLHQPTTGTSAPTTTLPAATLAAATTTRMAPMA
ncbi:hypothetical protein EMCRGX_G010898 [Ephydatia muelleri]